MIFTNDMRDLIKILNKKKVEYVIVGGLAVNYYGYPRSTLDMDILIRPSKENASKPVMALEEFGFGKGGLSETIFMSKGIVIHLGVEPNRINLLTGLKGVSNDTIFRNQNSITFKGLKINIISMKDLIKAKKKLKRLKDLADVEELEKLKFNLS